MGNGYVVKFHKYDDFSPIENIRTLGRFENYDDALNCFFKYENMCIDKYEFEDDDEGFNTMKDDGCVRQYFSEKFIDEVKNYMKWTLFVANRMLTLEAE